MGAHAQGVVGLRVRRRAPGRFPNPHGPHGLHGLHGPHGPPARPAWVVLAAHLLCRVTLSALQLRRAVPPGGAAPRPKPYAPGPLGWPNLAPKDGAALFALPAARNVRGL